MKKYISCIYENGQWHKLKPIIVTSIPNNTLITNSGDVFITNNNKIFLVNPNTQNLIQNDQKIFQYYNSIIF